MLRTAVTNHITKSPLGRERGWGGGGRGGGGGGFPKNTCLERQIMH